MLKDTENYPFIGDVIDQLKIGRTASTDISKQIASNSSEMSKKQTFRQAKTYVASRTFMQTDPIFEPSKKIGLVNLFFARHLASCRYSILLPDHDRDPNGTEESRLSTD